MSNYKIEADKIRSYLEELEKRHKTLDEELLQRYNNITMTEEVRRMKTMKLYLKDEIHKLNSQLIQLELQ